MLLKPKKTLCYYLILKRLPSKKINASYDNLIGVDFIGFVYDSITRGLVIGNSLLSSN